jgi:hypothetical protein
MLFQIGFDGCSASWRFFRTVSHRASGARSRTCPNHWTRRTSAYSGKLGNQIGTTPIAFLQCLSLAIRPLRVEELAELLTYDFDAAKGGMPKENPKWRWGDHEQAVLSTCSSLVTVVGDGGFRVVQFSHFSVKEFLTSNRLFTSGGDIRHHYISLEPAHTLLAQACLSTLLSLDEKDSGSGSAAGDRVDFPLAGYAAQHWIAHAQVDNVSSRVQGGMEQLLDPNKSHLSTWIQVHDVDRFYLNPSRSEPIATSLYYATWCGFRAPVEHLLTKYPQHVNVRGGGRGAALHAASSWNHVDVAQLLLERGGDVDLKGVDGWSPLSCAATSGYLDMVRLLLDHGAEVDSRHDDLWTPLHLATGLGHFDICQTLLEHNADVNSRDNTGRVPLHRVSDLSNSQGASPGIARLLLEHGADLLAKDKRDMTPLHVAVYRGRTEVVRLLLDHGANTDAKEKRGMSLVASHNGMDENLKMLTEHDAQAILMEVLLRYS